MDGDSLRDEERYRSRNQDWNALAEAYGGGRQNALWWRATAVIALVLMLEARAEAIFFYWKKPEVETVFALVDEETRVLATIEARSWTFDEQARADVAKDWLFHIRNRAQENYVTAMNRARAERLTAPDGPETPAAHLAATMLSEIDTKLGVDERTNRTKLGLAAQQIQASPVGHDDETNTTVVSLTWQERTFDEKGGTGPWQSMYMSVLVRAIQPTRTQQVMANGHGLYVVGFTPIGQGRPASVAAVQ